MELKLILTKEEAKSFLSNLVEIKEEKEKITKENTASTNAPSSDADTPMQQETQTQVSAKTHVPTVADAPAVPIAPDKTYQMDELAKAAAGLMDKGMMQQLQALTAKFGVFSLAELPKEKYGEYAMGLREMGAEI